MDYSENTPNRRNRALLVVGAIFAALYILGQITNTDDSPSSFQNATTAEQLATLDGANRFADDEVRPYNLALNAAENVCLENRETIGDMIYRGGQLAAEYGADISYLELLQALPVAVPREARPTQCADVIATLVALIRP